jgi:hypothetical protein
MHETWSLTSREDVSKQNAEENIRTQERIGERGKLNNEEHHNLFSSDFLFSGFTALLV